MIMSIHMIHMICMSTRRGRVMRHDAATIPHVLDVPQVDDLELRRAVGDLDHVCDLLPLDTGGLQLAETLGNGPDASVRRSDA